MSYPPVIKCGPNGILFLVVSSQSRKVCPLTCCDFIRWICWVVGNVLSQMILPYDYGSKWGTPKLWMVNTKLDIHICGSCGSLGLPFWPTSIPYDSHQFMSVAVIPRPWRMNLTRFSDFLDAGNTAVDHDLSAGFLFLSSHHKQFWDSKSEPKSHHFRMRHNSTEAIAYYDNG